MLRKYYKWVCIFLLLLFIIPAVSASPMIAIKFRDRHTLTVNILYYITPELKANYDFNHSNFLEKEEISSLLSNILPDFKLSSGNYYVYTNITIDDHPIFVDKNLSLSVYGDIGRINETSYIFLKLYVNYYFKGSSSHLLKIQEKKLSNSTVSIFLPNNWSFATYSSMNITKFKKNVITGSISKPCSVEFVEDYYFTDDLIVNSAIFLIIVLFIAYSMKRKELTTRNILVGSVVRNLIALFLLMTAVFAVIWIFGPPLEARFGVIQANLRLYIVKKYSLDTPWYVQYYAWWSSILKGEIGREFIWKGDIIDAGSAVLKSLVLFTICVFISYTLSIILGSKYKKRDFDPLLYSLLVLYSIPAFVIAYSFILLFQNTPELYSFIAIPKLTDVEFLRLIFPAFVLSLIIMAKPYLLSKNSAMREYREPYVVLAKGIGVNKKRVEAIVRRNSIIPVITDAVLTFGWILTSQTFVEVVFKIRGIGFLLFKGITDGNPFMVQYAIATLSFVTVLGSIIADILVYILDPRVRRA